MSTLARVILLTRRLNKFQLIFFSIIMAVVAAIIVLSILAVIYLLNPDAIDISTKAGSLSIKRGNHQDALILLSPGGGIDEPWIGSGVKVKKGDKIHITATGRIHCSLKKLAYAAETDKKLEMPWVGPDGMAEHQDSSSTYTDKYKLLPNTNGAHYGIGMLLAAIRPLEGDKKGQIEKIQPIGGDNTFIADVDGELLLTVNDIWLNQDSKDAYVRAKESNYYYYLNKAKQDNYKLIKPEDTSKWSQKTNNKKVEEQYQKREKQWQEITANKNWDLWYSDNVGAFSVSVSIESKNKYFNISLLN